MKLAIILLSGGLDSATTLAIAKQQGYNCFCLSFDYGQRAIAELEAAKQVAKAMDVAKYQVFNISLDQFGGSALTDNTIKVPEQAGDDIPITYVPARNTIFLSIALAWAEVIEAFDIFIGVNAVDYSGYPDCRPEFINAYQSMANLATKTGVEGQEIRIHTPLIDLTKAEIIQKGIALGVDYNQTISCYQTDQQGAACGQCDSCDLRQKGFKEAGIADPTIYQKRTL